MIGLIWAEGRNAEIGVRGTLPWHLPEDLAFFKSVTAGHPVIMGRTTWESLPPRFRPLPGRRNIVVTHNPLWSEKGAQRAGSLEEAISLVKGEDSWVIGGASIYRAALPLADVLAVTSVDISCDDADAFAPDIGPEWAVVSHDPPCNPEEKHGDNCERAWHVSANGLRYRFTRYKRSLAPTAS